MSLWETSAKVMEQFRQDLLEIKKSNGFLIDLNNVELWKAMKFGNFTTDDLPAILILTSHDFENKTNRQRLVTTTFTMMLEFAPENIDKEIIDKYSRLRRGIEEKIFTNEENNTGVFAICNVQDSRFVSWDDPVQVDDNLQFISMVVFQIDYLVDLDTP